jgi:DNA-binding response OmpR family regulator
MPTTGADVKSMGLIASDVNCHWLTIRTHAMQQLSNIEQTPRGNSAHSRGERCASLSLAVRAAVIMKNNVEERRILLVDDSEQVRSSLKAVLELNKFRVTTAANVGEALHLIDTETFDVLLCDLHMPGAGDGLTVVSAMRHTNPDAVTLMFTAYPALKEAMEAILLQADGVLLKPMAPSLLVEQICEKLNNRGTRKQTNIERVAAILERDAPVTISDWLARVEREAELTCVPLSKEQRTGHLPKLLQELVQRLRVPRELGTKHVSAAAVAHGMVRQSQGYSIPMIVEESRILQVSIFETLRNNLSSVDFSLLLTDVMTIADECDSQLKQTLTSFMGQAAVIAA